jgi:hypothetical protein
MSEKELMQDIEELMSKHPEFSERILIETDSVELLDAFNAEIAETERKCKKIAINPHTGKKRCIEWE